MPFDANAKRITKKGTTKERAYAAIALSSQRASRSVPAGCASWGAPRASREILRAAESGSPALDAESVMSRFQTAIFPESHPSACEERTGFQSKVHGINPKAYPKSAYISVGKPPMPQFCLDCRHLPNKYARGVVTPPRAPPPRVAPRAAAHPALRRALSESNFFDLVSPA